MRIQILFDYERAPRRWIDWTIDLRGRWLLLMLPLLLLQRSRGRPPLLRLLQHPPGRPPSLPGPWDRPPLLRMLAPVVRVVVVVP